MKFLCCRYCWKWWAHWCMEEQGHSVLCRSEDTSLNSIPCSTFIQCNIDLYTVYRNFLALVKTETATSLLSDLAFFTGGTSSFKICFISTVTSGCNLSFCPTAWSPKNTTPFYTRLIIAICWLDSSMYVLGCITHFLWFDDVSEGLNFWFDRRFHGCSFLVLFNFSRSFITVFLSSTWSGTSSTHCVLSPKHQPSSKFHPHSLINSSWLDYYWEMFHLYPVSSGT